EEAVKGHSYLSALHVQLPVTVATYLLNEKRDDVLKIENRLKIKVVLIPNVHLESPHYRIRKITQDSIESLTGKVSYNLVENAEETGLSYQTTGKAGNPPDAKAIVKNIAPAHPAPTISAKSFVSGLVTKITKLFKQSFTAEKKEPAPTNTGNSRYEQRQNNRNPKGNRSRPVGQNRSNHKIQTVRPNAPKPAENNTPSAPMEKPAPTSTAPRNTNPRSNESEARPENNRGDRNNDRRANTRPAPAAPRQQQSFAARPIENQVSPPQPSNNTAVGKPPVNQEWQETKPIIVVKEEASNAVANPIPTKAPEEIVKKEVKAVVNTITEPIDLGALQMVATDQNLAKTIVTPKINVEINTKRFNDIAANQQEAPRQENINYEIVETKA